MGANIPFGVASAIEIERHKCPSPDEIVRPKIGPVCKALWPFKTVAHVATIIGSTERHASRILSGEFESPGTLIAAIICEITPRHHS
jgi:hypothetical protein